MRKRLFILIVAFTAICSHAISQKETNFKERQLEVNIPKSETSSVEGIIKHINNNFKNQKDKAKAAFAWIANNIQYDYENLYTFDSVNDTVNSQITLMFETSME